MDVFYYVSCIIPFIVSLKGLNSSWIVDRFDSLVDCAENDIDEYWGKVNPEKVFEGISIWKI